MCVHVCMCVCMCVCVCVCVCVHVHELQIVVLSDLDAPAALAGTICFSKPCDVCVCTCVCASHFVVLSDVCVRVYVHRRSWC